MAVTENTFTGNGSTTNYSFTFPYLKTTDIKVSVAGTVKSVTSDYTFANATTVQFNTAPANSAAIRIYRETADTNLSATFYAGSAIKSQDLNDNFTQNLYVTQEVRDDSALALTNSREHDGDGTYTTAISKANTAVNTANAADAIADNAKLATDRLVATTSNNGATWTLAGNNTNASTDPKGVGYAVTQAEAAVASAATANNTAGNAVSTANAADTIADNAKLATDRLVATTSNNGTSWTLAGNNTNASTDPKGVGYAVTQSEAAVASAATANTTAGNAVTTANSATSTANAATATANTASTNASAAVTTANSASATATASANTVANSAIYQVVANYAALPALNSVDNGKFYQVSDSTSIENNFSSITGEPSNFVGHNGLTVKLKSNTTASPKVWEWQEYYANDPETRYRKKIIVENLNTIDEDYTITANNNAFSVGPVAVAANKTVTINANSLYFIG